MIEQALEFYDQLQTDLQHCHSLDQSEEKIIETCFKTSMDYWVRVKSWLKDYEFPDARSEIVFFKHIKPLFTSQIEFYAQCYKAVLFLPSKNKEEQILYWERELKQIDLFYQIHEAFMNYWRSETSDKDSFYFVRANNDGSNLDHAKNYDIDIEVATSHDWLVTAILSYEKYENFIKGKLREIE
jgi:hypothetical protein